MCRPHERHGTTGASSSLGDAVTVAAWALVGLVAVSTWFTAAAIQLLPSTVSERDATVRRTAPPLRGFSISMVVAAGAVVASLMANGSPVGAAGPDAAYRAGFALAVVGASACSRRWARTAATLIVAIAGASTAGAGAALLAGIGVAIGLAVLTWLGPRGAPVRARSSDAAHTAQRTAERRLAALQGAVLSVLLLRLPSTLPERASAISAGVVLIALLVGSIGRLPIGTGRVALLGSLLVVGTAAASGVMIPALLGARSDAQSGLEAARRGVAASRVADVTTAQRELMSASVSFEDARRALRRPPLRVARWLPLVGPNLAIADRITGDGSFLARKAVDAVVAADVSALRTTDGRIDVVRLAALRPRLAELRTALDRSRRSIAMADGPWVERTVSSRAADLADELADSSGRLERAEVALAALPELLGASGPRRYLLVVPTPAESRGSSGLIGSFGEITAVDGRLALERFGRTIELNSSGVPGPQRTISGPPDYLERYGRFEVNQLWQNVTLTPDFPTAAAVMAELYPQSGGRPVDGVISADPFALAGLIQLTGPVTVDGWNEPITSESAPRILLHDFYALLAEDANELRIDLQADVARAAWSDLLNGATPDINAVTTALGPAVQARHLQMWARDRVEQMFFSQLGIDGSFPVPLVDTFAAISNNAGGNKIDWFLHRDLSYEVAVDMESGSVRATADLALRNDAPATGLPRYVIGNAARPPAPEGTNVQYLSLYSAVPVTSVLVDGVATELERGTELGRMVTSLWIRIAPGATVNVVAELGGTLDMSSGYRLDLPCQPLVRPDGLQVTVHWTANSAFEGTGGLEPLEGEPGSAQLRSAMRCGTSVGLRAVDQRGSDESN